jgi:ketosteroid isomerase-like protein
MVKHQRGSSSLSQGGIVAERTKASDSPESRIALVRRLYDSTIDQDLYLDAYADDLIWYAPQGRGKLMGEHHGRDYMDEAFAHVVATTSEFDSYIGPDEILADEYDTVSFNRDVGTRKSDGAHFDFDVAIRWEIEDGQIKRMTEYIQDEEHKAEFF